MRFGDCRGLATGRSNPKLHHFSISSFYAFDPQIQADLLFWILNIPVVDVHCCYFMLSIWLICMLPSFFVDTPSLFLPLVPKKMCVISISSKSSRHPPKQGAVVPELWIFFIFRLFFFWCFESAFLAWHNTRGDDGPALQKRVRMPFFFWRRMMGDEWKTCIGIWYIRLWLHLLNDGGMTLGGTWKIQPGRIRLSVAGIPLDVASLHLNGFQPPG